jgi:hypothetical protein
MIQATYPHRRNRDGSFDSICTTCFATIGHVESESELTDTDQNHTCEEFFLRGRGAERSAAFRNFRTRTKNILLARPDVAGAP